MAKKGDQLELLIESAAFEGKAVGRSDSLVVFVPYAVPGDRARVRVIRKKKRYLEAVLIELLEESADRVVPRCLHFGTCGGCTLQNVDYPRQLENKRRQIEELMRRIGRFESVPVEPVIGSPRDFGYRNKMEFTFGSRRWLTEQEIAGGLIADKDFALGLHIPGRFDKILDLKECFLQEGIAFQILDRVRSLARSQDWSPYDARLHQGFLRNLVVRLGVNTGEVMVVLVTSSHDQARASIFRDTLCAAFPQITTIINSINRGRSPVAGGEEQVVLFGEEFLHEELGGLRFRIGPSSFFQPNTLQAEALYGAVRELARLRPGQTLYDVYCGIGSIGLFLAKEVGRVVGFESQSESVACARKNAVLNSIDNAYFEVQDASRVFDREILDRCGRPQVVILDPPRAGLDPKVCRGLLELRPPRIVYTSCNPATQARDLQILSGGYRVEKIQPVDMFPQTYHIESVAALEAHE